MLDLYGSRSAVAKVSRTIRITLAGESYELPVLSIRENREWKAQLNARTAALISALDDTDDLPAVLTVLSNQVDDLLEMLVAYDLTGVLPPRDEIESIRPDPTNEIFEAVKEVFKAANPQVGISLETVAAAMPETSLPPTSTPPPPTAGRRRKSKTN